MPLSFSDFHSYPETTPKTLFPVAHQEHSSIQQHSTMAQWFPTISCRTTLFCPKVLRHLGNIDLTAAEILCYPYEVHTRSVRDLKVGRKRAKRRKKTSFSFFYSSLLLSSLSLFFVWVKLLRNHQYLGVYLKKYVSKTGVTTRQKLCQKQLLQKEWHDMDMIWTCLIHVYDMNIYEHPSGTSCPLTPPGDRGDSERNQPIWESAIPSHRASWEIWEDGIPELLRPFSGAGKIVKLRQIG